MNVVVGNRQLQVTTVAVIGDQALYRSKSGAWLLASGERNEVQGVQHTYGLEQVEFIRQSEAEQWCRKHNAAMAY